MTVNTETDRNLYDGTGAQLVFPYTFPVLQNADLEVRLVAADGSYTVAVLDTDYTMTGAGTDEGGEVEFILSAPAADEQVLLIRLIDYLQPTDFKNQGRFFPRTHEKSFDRAAMQAIRLARGLDFSVKIPDSTEGFSTTLPAPTANYVFAINPTNDGATLVPPSTFASLAEDFLQSGSGAELRTVQDKLRDTVSVLEFPTLAEAKAAAVNKPVVDPDGITYKDVFNQPLNVFAEGGETTWDGAMVLRSESSSAHATESRVVFAIENRPIGSTVNAPTSADYCFSASIIKDDWFNSTVIGEIDALNITVRQGGQVVGQKSDCAGILLNVGNVHGVGFAALLEGTTSSFNPGTAVLDRQVQFAAGVLDSFADDYYGMTTTAVSGVLDAGVVVNSVSGASWTRFLQFLDVSGVDVFSVLGNGNLVMRAQSGTTPKKTLRVRANGVFSILNDAGAVEVFTVDDAGAVAIPGSITAATLRVAGAAASAPAGTVVIGGTTSTTATAGAAAALPATPTGYINIFIGGTAAKIPVYLP